ncbi:M14-type cytosolic carboxypeptidase [Rhodoligotrophos defluvii]|uniref:M14-type cytosolic carboxypeptidase n=1 Tax=Rhodoligotrophos defluvii TaxID=2561934 RepID=UPI0010C9CEF0|nr:M14-type cytosolic carboxypeptidase [Rhodoligotrophos defluvii]
MLVWHADFWAGNATFIGLAPDGAAEFEIRRDPGAGTAQWFCFQIAHGDRIPLRLTNADAATYPAGWPAFRVARSIAGQGWIRIATQYRDGTLSFTHEGGEAIYAAFPIFPEEQLDAMAGLPGVSRWVLGDTSAGRAIPAFSIGSGPRDTPQHWIIAAQHGGEPPSSWFALGLLQALAAGEMAGVLERARFHIVPVLNLDGMRAGHLRTNDRGIDPNRQWNSPQNETCPEAFALFTAMQDLGVASCLDVHTDFELPYVYFDVLDAFLGTPEPLAGWARRFEEALARASSLIVAGRRYPWTEAPSGALLSSMLGPAVMQRFGAPALTLELPICHFTDAFGRPDDWSEQCSIALGAAAAKAYAALP